MNKLLLAALTLPLPALAVAAEGADTGDTALVLLSDVAQGGIFSGEDLLHRQGAEHVLLEVQQVDELLRVLADGFG